MNEATEKLLQIVKENPDLPIVPIVDREIIGDDYGAYMGAWGGAYIDEYIIGRRYDDRVILKSDNDVFDTLENCMSAEEYAALPDDEGECRPYYDKLPWTKAIIVFVNKPEI